MGIWRWARPGAVILTIVSSIGSGAYGLDDVPPTPQTRSIASLSLGHGVMGEVGVSVARRDYLGAAELCVGGQHTRRVRTRRGIETIITSEEGCDSVDGYRSDFANGSAHVRARIPTMVEIRRQAGGRDQVLRRVPAFAFVDVRWNGSGPPEANASMVGVPRPGICYAMPPVCVSGGVVAAGFTSTTPVSGRIVFEGRRRTVRLPASSLGSIDWYI